MKRTTHARFVGIGVQRPEIVDKPLVRGRLYSNRALIEAQLRCVPLTDGEYYGNRPERSTVDNPNGGTA